MYILRKTINKAYFWNRTKRNLLKIQRKTLTTYSKKYVIGYIFSADGSEPLWSMYKSHLYTKQLLSYI